jgi:hypothetical protein
MQRFATRRFAATVGLTLALGATVWGNGEEFFTPAPTDRPPDLVYTGQIRDKVTRRPINDVIYFLITDKASGLDFPFVNDMAGHYRSPDIGASVRDLGRVQVDPSQLEIQVAVSGYKTQTLTKLPRKSSGLVAVDFRMERDPAFGVPLSASGTRDETPAKAPANWGLIGIGGLLAAVIALIAARTLIPRQSTAR